MAFPSKNVDLTILQSDEDILNEYDKLIGLKEKVEKKAAKKAATRAAVGADSASASGKATSAAGSANSACASGKATSAAGSSDSACASGKVTSAAGSADSACASGKATSAAGSSDSSCASGNATSTAGSADLTSAAGSSDSSCAPVKATSAAGSSDSSCASGKATSAAGSADSACAVGGTTSSKTLTEGPTLEFDENLAEARHNVVIIKKMLESYVELKNELQVSAEEKHEKDLQAVEELISMDKLREISAQMDRIFQHLTLIARKANKLKVILRRCDRRPSLNIHLQYQKPVVAFFAGVKLIFSEIEKDLMQLRTINTNKKREKAHNEFIKKVEHLTVELHKCIDTVEDFRIYFNKSLPENRRNQNE